MILCAFHDCNEEPDGPLLLGGVAIALVCEAHGYAIGQRTIREDGTVFGYVLEPSRCAGLTMEMALDRPTPIILEVAT